jgi:hypothetical protein
MPHSGTPLDVNDPTLLDIWLDHQARNAPERIGTIRLLERPSGIPPFRALTDDELGLNAPPDAIF